MIPALSYLFRYGSPDVPTTLDVHTFRSAFARLCALAALALCDGAGREDVRLAFLGAGDGLDAIRTQRVHVNHRVELVKHRAARQGVTHKDAVREMIRVAREVRDAVEVEWMLTLPRMGATP